MVPHILEIYLEGLAGQETAPNPRQIFVVYCAYALKACNWSRNAAAKRIGIGRATMYRTVQAEDFKTFIASRGWSQYLEGVNNATAT